MDSLFTVHPSRRNRRCHCQTYWPWGCLFADSHYPLSGPCRSTKRKVEKAGVEPASAPKALVPDINSSGAQQGWFQDSLSFGGLVVYFGRVDNNNLAAKGDGLITLFWDAKTYSQITSENRKQRQVEETQLAILGPTQSGLTELEFGSAPFGKQHLLSDPKQLSSGADSLFVEGRITCSTSWTAINQATESFPGLDRYLQHTEGEL